MSEGTILTPTDRSLFSMHPEDWVTQADSHDEECAYLKHALRLLLPGCFVARDLAVYWVPGQFQHPYVGPDIFIARRQPRVEDPKAWLVWEDGPLDLVIEVASDATRANEPAKRDQRYALDLQVPEYVFMDLYHDDLRLGKLVHGRYEWAAPDERGILYSQEFGVGFLSMAGERLVRVVSAEGEVVPTAQESAALQREAEERAEREARRARELEAELERLRQSLKKNGGRMEQE